MGARSEGDYFELNSAFAFFGRQLHLEKKVGGAQTSLGKRVDNCIEFLLRLRLRKFFLKLVNKTEEFFHRGVFRGSNERFVNFKRFRSFGRVHHEGIEGEGRGRFGFWGSFFIALSE